MCKFLNSLSRLHPGAIPALVSHLAFVQRVEVQPHWPPISSAMHIRAMHAIGNLFAGYRSLADFNSATARAFIAAGVVPPLIASFLTGDAATAAAASLPLVSILRLSRDGAIASALGKAPSKFVDILLRSGSTKEAVQGAELLGVVNRFAPETRAPAVAAGALPPLIALLRASSKDGLAESAASIALGFLCRDGGASMDLAVAEGLLESLFDIFKHSNAFNRRDVVLALSMILPAAKKEHLDRAFSCGAVQLLAGFISEAAANNALGVDAAGAGILPFFTLAKRERGDPGPVHHASVVDQLLEGCPLTRLMAAIGKASFPILLLKLIADAPGLHKALIGAGLLQYLVASLTNGGSASLLNGASTSRGLPTRIAAAFFSLPKLLRGPEAAATADAVISGGGLAAIVAALGREDDPGMDHGSVVDVALALFWMGEAKRVALVAAGAVPRLLEVLLGGGKEGPGSAKQAVACALLNLMKESASVAAEAAAAGFDAARLLQLAGPGTLPPLPAA